MYGVNKRAVDQLFRYLKTEIQEKELGGMRWNSTEFVVAARQGKHRQHLSRLFGRAFAPTPHWDKRWLTLSVNGLFSCLAQQIRLVPCRYDFLDQQRDPVLNRMLNFIIDKEEGAHDAE